MDEELPKEGYKIDDFEPPLFNDAVLMEHKAEYVRKPKMYSQQEEGNCIICRLINYDKSVARYEIHRTDHSIVFLNIYPYQVYHLLISPLKHKTGFEELTPSELDDISKLTQRCVNMIKREGNTESFNIGWNQGLYSGGSIQHFHIHLVPRYKNELNFMEVIAKTKPIIQSLEDVHSRLLKYQVFLDGSSTLEEIK